MSSNCLSGLLCTTAYLCPLRLPLCLWSNIDDTVVTIEEDRGGKGRGGEGLTNSKRISKCHKIGKDRRSRFWVVYKRVAEEHDGEFFERYTNDMDIVLFFSGLFSAVSTSFIVAMESNLRPDPSDTTNALLKQLVQMGLDNLAEVGSMPADPASTWSSAARIQMAAYASLSMSLLAAFGVVLGKQWLGYYKSNRYGRGSQEERGKRR
ncbi:uncharacterized protein BJ212DRAFT_1296110 [Suillus subaureus]|uniref:DUF6535 domain-containing protein n=1 Tax=Suillus subaureus TaxID=48587 RepID=A0A9P7EJU2_9AGAM|nr:uncharacterized protein BJ212DRAFT_1296110 [Suillus subaureus]KAG1823489.1 hypothetical protein BJ212DRAFT_1296110 [Suillus subaureus]